MIVSNPPYGLKWESNDNPLLINDERFAPAGVLAPKSDADYAFVMHMLHWLSSDGVCAFVESPGILFRGGAEHKIRKYLVTNNYIDTVIMMPGNLFFGATIATCIVVMRKNKTDNNVLIIDAKSLCDRSGKRNILGPKDIDIILSLVKERKTTEISVLVPYADIEATNFDLSYTKYVSVKKEEKEFRNTEIIIRELKQINSEIDSMLSDLEKE